MQFTNVNQYFRKENAMKFLQLPSTSKTILLFVLIFSLFLQAASACQSSTSTTQTATFSEAITEYSWKWPTNLYAHKFYPDGTYASYNLNFPKELNPALSGNYTVEGQIVTLEVGALNACEDDAVWVWEVHTVDSEHIEFTILEDGCPEAGSDSTGFTWTWTACELNVPEEGAATCEAPE
jgi:hypothetical protein